MSPVILNARRYSFAGLLPFVLSLLGYYLAPNSSKALFMHSFMAYSAVILSFIGAVHWGLVLHDDANTASPSVLTVAIMPATCGWLTLLLPPMPAVAILALAFPAIFLYEQCSSLAKRLPAWYLRLRIQLTLSVTAMQFIAFAGLVQHR